MKICTKCGEEKALEEFYRKKNRRMSRCKDCLKARKRAYAQKPEAKAYMKDYRKRPEVKARMKDYIKDYIKDYRTQARLTKMIVGAWYFQYLTNNGDETK